MKKICIFMHRFDGGGAEKMTVILANALHELGHKVFFCVRYNYGDVKYMLNPDITILDMKVSETSKIKKNIKNIWYLRKLMKEKNFDILLSITGEMSLVAALASLGVKNRIPMAAVIHNTLSQEKHSFQKIREWLFPMMDRCMDGVIAVSKAVRRDYIELCGADPGRVYTAYNPVVFEQIFELAGESTNHPWLAKNRNWKTLVLAGRLSYQKNHELMLQALKKLCLLEDYRLILLGQGELEEDLKKTCGSMGIADRVDFFGYVKNPYAFYSEADAVVLSSRFEGLPTVLIEALACGSRIVSTDCPSGPREILCDGRYGVLVPVGNAGALAEGIRKAMEREPDRNELKKRAMDFSVDHSVQRYLDVIEKIEQNAVSRGRKKGRNK